MTQELHSGLGSGVLREAWRTGSKVPVNVYEGDRPVCQCHTVADARLIVKAVNALLSLSSPIEPPSEIANLIAFHEKETDVWAEQLVKARERIAELEAEASSEIRERVSARK